MVVDCSAVPEHWYDSHDSGGRRRMAAKGPTTGKPSLSLRRRDADLDALASERFDLVVIGGGITGAGIAREAARRGLAVALLEARDFACGTSSKSTKLIHGGLRYLAQAEFGVVRKSALERKEI